MEGKYDGYRKEFLSILQEDNSPKYSMVNYVFRRLNNIDLTQCDNIELVKNALIGVHPTSKRDIGLICYGLNLYLKWLEEEKCVLSNNNLRNSILEMDKTAFWEQIKDDSPKKFVSYKEMMEILDMIEIDQLNGLYYRCLMQCVYEGIYSQSLIVFDNLRSSSINGDIITLNNGNEVYDLKVTSELARKLRELARIDTWERGSKWGVFERKTVGFFPDSCFKIEESNRSSDSGTFKFSYHRKMRKVFKEYFEDRKMTPHQIFISGIMHRIKLKLNKENISMHEAFKYDTRKSNVTKIIREELDRCHYNIKVNNFKEDVCGFVDVFDD